MANKLYQPVLDKIEELGEVKAAEFFGKSRQTVYVWKKQPTKIPMSALQTIVDNMQLGIDAAPTNPAPPEMPVENQAVVAPDPVVVPEPPVVLNDQPLADPMGDILRRLDRLEDFARMMTDPDRNAPTQSMIRPIQSIPQSIPTPVPIEQPLEVRDPAITTPSGDIPVAPTPTGLPPNFGGGWNKPYQRK